MRLDRFITLGLVHPVRDLFHRPDPARRQLPVLMYHSISDDPEPTFSPYYKVCTSPQRFTEHMQWLAEAGYRGVTLTEGLAWLRSSATVGGALRPDPHSPHNTPPKTGQLSGLSSQASSTLNPQVTSVQPVAITFDDGFRDFHTAAFPALQRHGFTATMYLATAYVGDERRSFKSRECLTWGEVRELAAAGMEFGSHTVNHPVLVKLPWDEIEAELRTSKVTIEDRLQRPAPAFAYPFAYPQEQRGYTTRLNDLLQSLGYASACTTIVGRMQPGDSPFQVKRLPANTCDDRRFFLAKLRGGYDWLRLPQSGIRRANALLKPNPRPLSLSPAH